MANVAVEVVGKTWGLCVAIVKLALWTVLLGGVALVFGVTYMIKSSITKSETESFGKPVQVIPEAPKPPDEYDQADLLIAALKQSGVVTHAERHLGFTQVGTMKLTIGSLNYAVAQAAANETCKAAQTKFTWRHVWTVEVYYPVGDRPAARCQFGSHR
jgi:hypothetical protein